MADNFLGKLKKNEVSLRDLKHTVKMLAEEKNFDQLQAMYSKDKRVMSALISLSYDKSSELSWNALHLAGKLIGALARSDKDDARGHVQRLIWNMSDESGTIPWTVPEILGEVVREMPECFDDIPSIIYGYAHSETEDNIFLAGVLYALGRIGEQHPQYIDEDMKDVVREELGHKDPEVRAHALIAAKRLGIEGISEALDHLKESQEEVYVYYEDRFQKISLHDLAGKLFMK